MDKGIYTALSGGIAKSHELELVANNLANALTPGFKRDAGTFNEYLTELRRNDTADGLQREIQNAADINGRPSGDKSFVEMDAVYTDFRQGAIEKTSRTLDVALGGPGFFEVSTPSGVCYTRAGNFNLNKQGELVTANGYPVLQAGEGPAEGRTIRLGQGAIQIDGDGSVHQNGSVVAKIGVKNFFETQWLEKVGQSYFKNKDPQNINPAGGYNEFHQGHLEGSNVNPVHEMTQLITVTRSYESHMQAIKTYQDMDNRTVNEIAKG